MRFVASSAICFAGSPRFQRPGLTLLLVLCLCLPVLAQSADTAALRNQLADHPSPYLAMHGRDPVHWQTWSAATLALARKLNRPLLLSIGYFSCHWCHVMQRESFQDAELAQRINSGFIPVKIDRELEPALDAELLEFVRRTRGRAGWPLTVILTPEGYPLVGVTYLPREDFADLLDNVLGRWRDQPARLRDLAREAAAAWQPAPAAGAATRAMPVAKQVLQEIARRQDELEGGFGQQAKFPMVAQLLALLERRQRTGDKSFDEFLRLTLDHMAARGLRDLLGGGFFRYTVDTSWHTPHYEKMLYDNAWLSVLYLRAADEFGDDGYRAIGLDTVDFLLRDMRTDAGYFISSFSAVDAQGREGYHYLWQNEQLQALLNEDELRAVYLAWFDAQAAESGYGHLPRQRMPLSEVAERLQWTREKLDSVLATARATLLEARTGRSLPADTKGIAAWNGLALTALAAASASSDAPRYRAAGTVLSAYIAGHWWNGERLVRALHDGQPLADATLEDYALVAQGLRAWQRLRPGDVDARLVEQLLRTAWRDYYRDGRWLLDATPLVAMSSGRLALEDAALPSASAVIVDLTLQHEGLRGDGALRDRVKAHFAAVGTGLDGAGFWYASYLKLLEDQPLR